MAAITIQVISGIAVGCIYGLVAIGFSMIFRAMSLVNFAQGDIMMVGAFIGFSLISALPMLPFWIVMLLAAMGTGLLGLLIERVAFRGAVRRQAGQIYLVLLTLGVGIVLSNAARLIWGANPVVYPIPLTHTVITVWGYPLPAVYLYVWATMILLLIGLHLLFTKTWIGIALRASAEDRETAQTMGINAATASSTSFGLAAAIGAAAGVLYAPITYASFDMGAIGIKAFAAAVVGSLGSIPGAVLGGLVIGVGESVGAQMISTEFQDSIAFAIMILVLLIRPNGLLGRGTA